MERTRRREPDEPDRTPEQCLVCEQHHIDEGFVSLFLSFQCQDGEDLLGAVNWYRRDLQNVKDILRNSPKCISYMGKEIYDYDGGEKFQAKLISIYSYHIV